MVLRNTIPGPNVMTLLTGGPEASVSTIPACIAACWDDSDCTSWTFITSEASTYEVDGITYSTFDPGCWLYSSALSSLGTYLGFITVGGSDITTPGPAFGKRCNPNVNGIASPCQPITPKCADGEFQYAAPTATSDRVCVSCPTGSSFITSTGCTVQCPPGTTPSPDRTGCDNIDECAKASLNNCDGSTNYCIDVATSPYGWDCVCYQGYAFNSDGTEVSENFLPQSPMPAAVSCSVLPVPIKLEVTNAQIRMTQVSQPKSCRSPLRAGIRICCPRRRWRASRSSRRH